MSWDADSERRVGEALLEAKKILSYGGTVEPSGSSIVLEVIRRINQIDKMQRVDGHSPQGFKSLWMDYLHDAAERLEELKMQMIAIAGGQSPESVFGFRLVVSPADIALMESTQMIFRDSMVGNLQSRDWKILIQFAEGCDSRRVAKSRRISPGRAADRKKLQCNAIWNKVRYMMPVTKETGIVFREAA